MKQFRINLLKVAITLSLLLICIPIFPQKHFSLKSPDEKLEVKIEVAQTITYSIAHQGDIVLNPSTIAMEIEGGKHFGINAKVTKEKRNKIRRNKNR